MVHINNGHDKGLVTWFMDLMAFNHVAFDYLGLSFYPGDGAKLSDLESTLAMATARYNKPMVIAEVSDLWTPPPNGPNTQEAGTAAQQHLQIRSLGPFRHLQHARVVAEARRRVHPQAQAHQVGAVRCHNLFQWLALRRVEIVVLDPALLTLQHCRQVMSQQHAASRCCHGCNLEILVYSLLAPHHRP